MADIFGVIEKSRCEKESRVKTNMNGKKSLNDDEKNDESDNK